MNTKITMGTFISQRRKELGITQQELAKTLGIAISTIYRWESDLRCPDTSLIPKLANALKLTTDELYSLTMVNNNINNGNMSYDESITREYRKNIVLSLLLIFSPLIGVFGYIAQDSVLIVLLWGMSIPFIGYSMYNVVTKTIKHYRYVSLLEKNIKHIILMKNYVLIYILTIYLLLSMLVITFYRYVWYQVLIYAIFLGIVSFFIYKRI